MLAAVLIAAVVLLAAQRALDVRRSRRNEALLRSLGALEHGRGHYPWMVALHALWPLSTLVEGLARGPELPPYWPAALTAFALAQALRYWSIFALGPNWTTTVVVVPRMSLVRRGPYRYLAHPNYVAVALELAAFPLLFGAWITAAAATAANALVLRARLRAERKALSDLAAPATEGR